MTQTTASSPLIHRITIFNGVFSAMAGADPLARRVLGGVFVLFSLGKLPALYYGDRSLPILIFFVIEGATGVGLICGLGGRHLYRLAVSMMFAFACVSTARAVAGWGCECFGNLEVSQRLLALVCASSLWLVISRGFAGARAGWFGWTALPAVLGSSALFATSIGAATLMLPGAQDRYQDLLSAIDSPEDLRRFSTIIFIQHDCEHCQVHLDRLAIECSLNPLLAHSHAIVELPPYADDFDRSLLFPKLLTVFRADVAHLVPCLPFELNRSEVDYTGGCP